MMASGGFAFFFDFDGVLADIAPRPDAVTLAPGLVPDLLRLRERVDGALAIVTGRPVAQIDHLLGRDDVDIAGLHGLEMRLAGRRLMAETHSAALRPLVQELARLPHEYPGLVVEDKGQAVAVHWRLAPAAEAPARAALDAALQRLGEGWKLQPGKAVAEIVPAVASKGEAILRFLQAKPYAARRPVFAGDDLTDESGFTAVNRLDGLSVRVGPGPSAARLRVPHAAAFRTLIAAWADGADVSASLHLSGA